MTKTTKTTPTRRPRLTEMFEDHIAALDATKVRINGMLDAAAMSMLPDFTPEWSDDALNGRR